MVEVMHCNKRHLIVCCLFVICLYEYWITVMRVLGLFSWHPTLMTLSVTFFVYYL